MKNKRVILKIRNFTSIVLAILMLSTSFVFRMLASYNGVMKNDVMASSTTINDNNTEEFKIALNYNPEVGTEYNWHAEKSEKKVIKLKFSYEKIGTSNKYNEKELKVDITGIGKLNRDETLKALKVEENEINAEKQEVDWSYEYNSVNDIYTFYNNKVIEENEVFSGSIELLWEFESRQCVDRFSKKLQAVLYYGENTIVSNELNFKFTSDEDTYKDKNEEIKPAEDGEVKKIEYSNTDVDNNEEDISPSNMDLKDEIQKNNVTIENESKKETEGKETMENSNQIIKNEKESVAANNDYEVSIVDNKEADGNISLIKSDNTKEELTENEKTEQNSLNVNDKLKLSQIKINNTIKASSLEKSHGDATFIFRIVGKDESDNTKITLYRTITFSSSDIKKEDENGNITKSIIISEAMPYKYEITEEENFRYKVFEIKPVTENSDVTEGAKKRMKIGIVNLLNQSQNNNVEKGEITFINEKANNSLLTDSKLLTT